jgi:hypothetical protein
MTYEELKEEAEKLGLTVVYPSLVKKHAPARINPLRYSDRPLSRIVATAIATSDKECKSVTDELAYSCGITGKNYLWNKLNRNSFSVEQLSKILKYCGGKLTVTYANGDTEVIDI